MGIVADSAGRLFVFEGSMDEFLFGDAFVATVTQLGAGCWIREGVAVSVSFMTELAGIVALGQRPVDHGAGP